MVESGEASCRLKKKYVKFIAWGTVTLILVIVAIVLQRTVYHASASATDGSESNGDAPFQVRGDVITAKDEALSSAGVSLETVKAHSVPETLTLTAKSGLNMETVTHVSALFGGKVTDISVGLGQQVLGPEAPGGPTKLCVIESNDLAQDKANWLQGLIQVKIDEQGLARAKELFAANVLAEKFLIDAESQLLKDKSAEEASRQQLLIFGLSNSEIDAIRKQAVLDSSETGNASAATRPAKSTEQIQRERMGYALTAPRSGVIAEKFVSGGETAVPQTNLFTIADTRALWVWGDVYERDLDQVKKGQPMKVYFTSEPTRARDCAVDWISPVLDPNTHSVKIRGLINNSDGHLLSDMHGTMVITTGDGKNSLVVPADTVVNAGNEAYVFVELGSAGGKTQFRRTPVQISAVDAGFGTADSEVTWLPVADSKTGAPQVMVRISRGLESGQVIVKSGALGLFNEMPQQGQ